MHQRAVLAGGCFWGMQDLIRKLPGVVSTRVGYTGGDTPNATYRNHGTHAEGIEIVFDTAETSYRRILEYFFQIHDPTTRNRQGNDIGTSYRSAIYYISDEQKRCGGDDRRRERVGPVAGQGRHRSHACRRLLGSRAEHQDYSGSLSERLHLPLHPARVEAASQNCGLRAASKGGNRRALIEGRRAVAGAGACGHPRAVYLAVPACPEDRPVGAEIVVPEHRPRLCGRRRQTSLAFI